MNSILHALNIGTLATWMSVATFSTVGMVVPGFEKGPAAPTGETETLLLEDLALGEETAPAETTENAPSPESEVAETLPLPPELPEIVELSPLPEVPDLQPAPEPEPKPSEFATRPKPPAQSAPRPVSRNQGAAPRATSAPPATPLTGGGGSQMSESARLAAGRIPKPAYPSQARRDGQKGTVVIEFSTDSDGRVISAYVKSSSGWPLLDNTAVKAMLKAKFPAGPPMMRKQKPIVFRLN